MSQPAASSDQISSSVAWTSRVSVLVIDCTVRGAPPPTLTLPSWICLLLRRLIIRSALPLRLSTLPEESKRAQSHQIVVERVHHQQHQEHEAHPLGGLPLGQR